MEAKHGVIKTTIKHDGVVSQTMLEMFDGGVHMKIARWGMVLSKYDRSDEENRVEIYQGIYWSTKKTGRKTFIYWK